MEAFAQSLFGDPSTLRVGTYTAKLATSPPPCMAAHVYRNYGDKIAEGDYPVERVLGGTGHNSTGPTFPKVYNIWMDPHEESLEKYPNPPAPNLTKS